MSDLATILRILAKHAAACADELDGLNGDPPVAEPSSPGLEAIKAQHAERRKRLGGSGA